MTRLIGPNRMGASGPSDSWRHSTGTDAIRKGRSRRWNAVHRITDPGVMTGTRWRDDYPASRTLNLSVERRDGQRILELLWEERAGASVNQPPERGARKAR
jgi:hypothetical protein